MFCLILSDTNDLRVDASLSPKQTNKQTCYHDKVYTGHALDIEGFITIGDITIGPYMGQKSL